MGYPSGTLLTRISTPSCTLDVWAKTIGSRTNVFDHDQDRIDLVSPDNVTMSFNSIPKQPADMINIVLLLLLEAFENINSLLASLKLSLFQITTEYFDKARIKYSSLSCPPTSTSRTSPYVESAMGLYL